MDNIRFVLVMAMLMISYMLWESWQIDYGPKPQAIVSDKPEAMKQSLQIAHPRRTPIREPVTPSPPPFLLIQSLPLKPMCLP